MGAGVRVAEWGVGASLCVLGGNWGLQNRGGGGLICVYWGGGNWRLQNRGGGGGASLCVLGGRRELGVAESGGGGG